MITNYSLKKSVSCGSPQNTFFSNQANSSVPLRSSRLFGIFVVFVASLFTNFSFGQYCASTAQFTGDTELLGVTLGSLNNVSNCTTVAPGAGSVLSLYSNFTGLPAPNLTTGTTVPMTVTAGTCGGNFTNAFKVFIDWNGNQSFTDVGDEVYVSPAVNGPHTQTFNVVVPTGALPGITRMRIVHDEQTNPALITPCGTYFYGETEDYNVQILSASACSGTPTGGTAVSSLTNPCPGIPYNITLSGATTSSGLTYQWQSSPDGITYTNIAGATNSFYSTTASVGAFFQCIITCTASSASATSAPVQVTVSNFLNCYCASNATSASDEDIFNVSIGSLSNSSTCTTTGGPGSVPQMYSNYTNLPATPLARGVSYPASIQIGTCGGNFGNFTKMWIDYNQNGLFTDPGEEVFQSPASVNGPHVNNFNVLIPLTATLGITRMRVVNVEFGTATSVVPCGPYTWGETEDYFVMIAPVPTCPQPTNLLSLGSTTTSVDLAWTAGGAENQWQVQYGTVGFQLGTGTTTTVNTTPATLLTALAPFGFYDVYVRAICGPGDTSFWAPKLSFNTFGLGNFMENDNNCHPDGFIDITATGVGSVLQFDGLVSIPAPFPVYFQNTLINSFNISNNGLILFDNTATFFSSFNSNTITTAANGVYPFWDDLDDNTGRVIYETQGVTPNRRLVVQWNKKHDLFLVGDSLRFQVVFEESTGKIYYQYENSVVGSPLYDNGASATVGLAGPSQDFPLSFDNSSYLSENSCVTFYYTNCPKIRNLVTNYVFADETSFTWTAGLAGETSWDIIYGPSGFDPATGGTTITVSTPSAVISGLLQKTDYDFYIYSNCSPTLKSVGNLISIRTLPFCADPAGVALTSGIDSLMTTWNWTAYTPVAPNALSGFDIQYGFTGFTPGTGTVVSSGTNFSDTTFDAALFGGGVYQVYVQALCGPDSSNLVGPFTTVMPLTNDSICQAETLQVDGTVYVFNNTGATSQLNEGSIAPPVTGAQTTTGWANNAITRSTWFQFTAPASGQMRISGVDRGFNGQMAVYDAASCSPIGALVLVAANDDEIDGPSLAPNFTVCGLTPGVQYFLMHDSFGSTATGVYSIKMTPISLDAGLSAAQIEVCVGDTIDLFTGISGNQPNGVWEDLSGTFQIINGNFVKTGTLASGIYNYQYKLVDGCARDSSSASIRIFPRSAAGNDGAFTICLNEPTNALLGLSGVFNTGGTWFGPSGASTPSVIAAGQLSVLGGYNFTYIVGNGVCPNDTAVVTINVLGTCNYLSIDENSISGVKVFPNPTNGVLNLQAEDLTEDLSLELFDMNGKVIWTGGMLMNNTDLQIDLMNFERGVYILKLNNSTTTSNYRVVKN